jgi:hypothetical protein
VGIVVRNSGLDQKGVSSARSISVVNIIEMGTKTSDKKGSGCFLSGASFAADGNVITSDLNFLRFINYRGLSQVRIVN